MSYVNFCIHKWILFKKLIILRTTIVLLGHVKYRCPREMAIPQFGDPGPHVPSDMEPHAAISLVPGISQGFG